MSLLLAVLVGPEGQVIAEELHDKGGVLVAVLLQAFEGNDGFIKGRFGGAEGQFPVAQDLEHEDRVVQGEAQADGVRAGEVARRLCGGDVGGLGILSRLCFLVTRRELGEVAVVVGFPVELNTEGLEIGRREGQ